MFVMGPLGFLHGEPEGVRDHIPDPRLAGAGVGIIQGLHIKCAFGDDLVDPAVISGQIPLVHILPVHGDLTREIGIVRDVLGHGLEFIAGKPHPCPFFIIHCQPAEIGAVGTCRDDEGLSDDDRFGKDGVGVAADDHVDFGYGAGEVFVLGSLLQLRCAGVGKADDQICIFFVFQKIDHFLACLDRIAEGDRFGEGGVDLGILPQDAEQSDPDAPALDHRIGDDRVLPEGLLQIAVTLAVRAEDHVGGDHEGEFLFHGAGLSERLRQAFRMEIEIVIPEGHHVVTHRRHEAEFRRLRHEGRVEEGPHAEVAGIDEERPVPFSVLPDEREKLRISAPLYRGSVRGGYPLREKVGVQIMGEQNDEPLAGRRLSGGETHPGNAGSNHEQGDYRRDHTP